MKKLVVIMSILVMNLYAAEKMQCKPLTKEYLEKAYGSKDISFDTYMKLIDTRQVRLEKGKSLKDYIAEDTYAYQSTEEAMKLYRMANGMPERKFKKGDVFFLPFCSNNIEREIASIGSIKKNIKKSDLRKKSQISFGISAQYGNLDMSNGSENLSMNFMKATISGSYKLSSDYFLTSNLSVVQFRDIEHSDSSETVTPSDLYPEFGISLFKNAGKLKYGVGYDQLQYFVRDPDASGVSLSPSQTHRLTAKLLYSYSDRLNFFSSIGVLRSFEEDNISGYDAAIGASYSLGAQKKFSLTPVFYKGLVERDSASKADDSTVMALSFSYRF